MFYGRIKKEQLPFAQIRKKGGALTFHLFKKNRHADNTSVKKPRAVAFVDYDNWYISCEKNFHIKPDIKGWRDELSRRFDILDILFFADFTNSAMRQEISRIREITNAIIETQNTSSYYKKDFTDFIMLDHIYQRAFTSKDIDTYIIFSGDGHFSSVASFLITKCRKEVGIYGVRDSVSAQLANTASWIEYLPRENERDRKLYYMLLRNLKYLSDNAAKKDAHPTFWATVEAAARYNGESREELAEALRGLIEKGYIYQTEEAVSYGKKRKIKVLNVRWEQVKKDGLLKEIE